ncbi:MAG: multidrug effflux MFS transporter [Sphingomonadaceae bacterium]|nr:multidrug effflux MFS transporter [Sphingomonadaceae bacterium]
MHAPIRPDRPAPGLLILLGVMTAFGALSMDMYLPAMPSMERALGASPAITQLTIAAFLLGTAAGQLLWGAWSDRAGRRGPLFVGVGLFTLSSAACALAPSAGTLIAARVVQGFGSCAGNIIARASVRDTYGHADSARVFTWLTLVFGVAPVVAPFIGTGLLAVANWRAIFWALTAFGIAIGLWAAARLPETRDAASRARARVSHPLATYHTLLGRRRIVGHVVTSALGGSALFAYVSSASILYISDFGLPPALFSAAFASCAIAMVAGSQINRQLLKRYHPDDIAAVATAVSAVSAVLFLCVALAGRAGPVQTFAASVVQLAAFGLTTGNLQAGAMSSDPDDAGSIAALIGVVNFVVGAAVSAAVSAAHDGTALPLAAAIAISLTLALPAFLTLARRQAA